jgi:hypothetical protein
MQEKWVLCVESWSSLWEKIFIKNPNSRSETVCSLQYSCD